MPTTPLQRRARSAFVAGTIAVLGHPAIASASPREDCAHTAEDAQALRDAGKLRASKDALLRCAQRACPRLVAEDCARWLSEVERALPTVVISARDARGIDVVGLDVFVDEERLLSQLDGRALALDPGPHHVRVVARSGETIQADVLVAQGERDRPVALTFAGALKKDGTEEPSPARPAPPAPAPSRPAEEPPAPPTRMPWVLGTSGLGLAAIGVGIFFDLRAWSVQDGCGASRTCTPSEVDDARSDRTIAQVSLVVGGLALATAAILFFTRPATHPGTARVDPAPR